MAFTCVNKACVTDGLADQDAVYQTAMDALVDIKGNVNDIINTIGGMKPPPPQTCLDDLAAMVASIDADVGTATGSKAAITAATAVAAVGTALTAANTALDTYKGVADNLAAVVTVHQAAYQAYLDGSCPH